MSQVYKTGSTFTASPSTLQRSTAPKKQDLKIVIIIPHKKTSIHTNEDSYDSKDQQ